MTAQTQKAKQSETENDQLDAVRPKYPITPAVIRQRSEASRKHGLYSAASKAAVEGRDSEPEEIETPGRRMTPWRRRRERVRGRVRALLAEFPHLRGQPPTLIEALAETEIARGTLFIQLGDGVPGAINAYARATVAWEKLAARLGVLPDNDAEKSDPINVLFGKEARRA